MAGGATKNQALGAMGMLVVVLMAILAYTLLGGHPLNAAANPQTGSGSVSGICPSTGIIKLLLSAKESVLTTTGTETLVNSQTTGVYGVGATSPMDTITLSSGGDVASTSGHEPNCGGQFYLVFPGTTSTTYYNELIGHCKGDPNPAMPCVNGEPFSISAGNAEIKFVGDKVGSFSLTAMNGSSSNWQDSGMTVAEGGNTDYIKNTMDVQGSSGADVKGPFIVGFAYNPSNYTTIHLMGVSKTPCPSWGTVASYNNATTLFSYQECYILPGTTELKNGNDAQAKWEQVTATTCKAYTAGAAANCDYVIRVADYGSYVKNGQPVWGYVNPDSGNSDLSATDGIFKVSGGA